MRIHSFWPNGPSEKTRQSSSGTGVIRTRCWLPGTNWNVFTSFIVHYLAIRMATDNNVSDSTSLDSKFKCSWLRVDRNFREGSWNIEHSVLAVSQKSYHSLERLESCCRRFWRQTYLRPAIEWIWWATFENPCMWTWRLLAERNFFVSKLGRNLATAKTLQLSFHKIQKKN